MILKILIFTSSLLFTLLGTSQNVDTYLVVKDKLNNTSILFPGTTDLKLYKGDSLVLSRKEMILNQEYEIEGRQRIDLQVSWSDEPRSMILEDTYIKLEQKTMDLEQAPLNLPQKSNDTADLRLTFKSFTWMDGYYNAIVKFSNGITFSYIDRKVTFDQNGEKLAFSKEYVVTTEEGILKLSYDPKTSEVWYVFEPNQD